MTLIPHAELTQLRTEHEALKELWRLQGKELGLAQAGWNEAEERVEQLENMLRRIRDEYLPRLESNFEALIGEGTARTWRVVLRLTGMPEALDEVIA
jgi:hypothetical protein